MKCQHSSGPNRNIRYACQNEATHQILPTTTNGFAKEVQDRSRFYCSKHKGGWNKDCWLTVKL